MFTINRRTLIGTAAMGALVAPPRAALGASPPVVSRAVASSFARFETVHQGLGTIDVRLFDFGAGAAPANFLIYDLPVGASEGVHLHNLSDPALGPYDEFYHILEGRGIMTVNDERIAVSAGDHIFVPLDNWRGIENADASAHLKVFLTYIDKSA